MAVGFRFAGLIASALALAGLAAPAQAQFGAILRSGTRAATETADTDSGCASGKKKSAGSRFLGALAGEAASSAAGGTGVGNWIMVPDVAGELTTAIACRLDPNEQKQAAQATLEATRSLEDDGGEGAQVGESRRGRRSRARTSRAPRPSPGATAMPRTAPNASPCPT